MTASQHASQRENNIKAAAVRAKQEAEARKEHQLKKEDALSAETEKGGRKGPEPVRYNDWERRGIAVDF